MVARNSDHKPLLLYFNMGEKSSSGKKILFRYEACWTIQEECEQLVWFEWMKGITSQIAMERV